MSCGTCGIQASNTMQEDTGVPAGAPQTQRPRCPACKAFVSQEGATCNNPRCPTRNDPAAAPVSPPETDWRVRAQQYAERVEAERRAQAACDAEMAALRALGNQPFDWAWLDLRQTVLHDQRTAFRQEATRMLARGANQPEVSAVLSRVLFQDEDYAVRYAALEALRSAGEAALPVLEKALAQPGLCYGAITALGYCGEQAVPLLAPFLQVKEGALRREAREALTRIGGAAAFTALTTLTDPDAPAWDQEAVLPALATTGGDKALPYLVAALEHAPAAVQKAAIMTLAGLGPRAVPPLAEALLPGTPRRRHGAILALHEMRSAESMPVLVLASGDGDPYVARIATKTLGQIGGPEVVEPLIRALRHPEAGVALEATLALEHHQVTAAGPAIRPLLAHADGGVRLTAARALGHLGDREALPALLPLLQDSNGEVSRMAFSAAQQLAQASDVPALVPLLAASQEYVRCYAADILTRTGSPTAIPALRQAVTADPSWRVRQAAVEALGAIGGDEALAAIEPALRDARADVGQSAVKMLRRHREPAGLRLLERSLTTTPLPVAAQVAEALGEIGDADTVAVLQAAQSHPQLGPNVRRALRQLRARRRAEA